MSSAEYPQNKMILQLSFLYFFTNDIPKMLSTYQHPIPSILLTGLLFFSGLTIPAYAQNQNSSAVVGVRAPVWTEELGEVPLDQYTEKELGKMVHDYWTPERMRNAIPAPMGMMEEVSENTLHEMKKDEIQKENSHVSQESPAVIISLPASLDRHNRPAAKPGHKK